MDEARHDVETEKDFTGALSMEGSFGTAERTQLNKIFADFGRIATALDKSYQDLEGKVSSLKRELSKTRLERRWDLAEKDRLANRLASLVSVLPSAVLVLNKHGLIIDRNRRASEALNEPLIGLNWDEVVQREEANTLHNELHFGDGRIYSIAKNNLAVSDDSAIFLTDVTEVHKFQNELARSKRLSEMGEMASSMAHQIRTPLSSAHLYMSPLARAELEPSERISIVHKVQNRLSHIGKLIDSMLGFVRGSKTNTSPVTLRQILDTVEGLVASDVERFNAILIIPDIDESLLIQADVESLSGAIANLVINAFEMNPDSPKVVIDIHWFQESSANRIEISVKDNGPGIAPDQLERIFDPFFTTRTSGTGLGLAIAAMTCKELGGSIHAKNHRDGGAEFIVSLPVFQITPYKAPFPLGSQSASLWTEVLETDVLDDDESDEQAGMLPVPTFVSTNRPITLHRESA